MARLSYREWQKKQNEYEQENMRRGARSLRQSAERNEKQKHVAGVGEQADTSARLYQLSQMAQSIRANSAKRSQAYRNATRMLKDTYGAENSYRNAMSSFTQPQEQNAINYGERLNNLANARMNTQVNTAQNARDAYISKYGDVENMSADELRQRISNLEQRKASNQAKRAVDGLSPQATNTGMTINIPGYNNNMPEQKRSEQQVNLLTQGQRDRLERDDARADDYLQVYKKALPAAVVREEEKKLSAEDKKTILRAADVLRQDTRTLNGMGGTIIGDLVNNVNPAGHAARTLTSIKTADAHEELDPKIEALKKRGIDTDYLLDYYATYLDNKDAERQAEEVKQFAKDAPIISSILSVPANLVGGINSIGEDVRHAIRTSDEKPLDINQKNRELSNFAQNVRNTVSEGIDNSVWRFIYNAGMSTADSAAAILAGGGIAGGLSKTAASRVTQSVMSIGAADQTYNDAIERGLDPQRALMTGITAGVAEWVTEKYSIDGLKALALNKPSNLKNLVKNIGKQMVTEGSEEAASDALNLISDNIINGKKSEFNQSIKKYREQGLTGEQARKAAMMDWLSGTAYDAAAGAFSGALMGAGGQAASFRQTQNEISDYGSTLEKAGDKETTLEYAKRFDDLTKMAEKAGTDNKVGKVAEAVEKKVNEKVAEAKTPEELQAVYEELSENAPDSVRIQVDSAVSQKALELSEKDENEEYGRIYEQAVDSFIETSNRVDERIKENDKKNDQENGQGNQEIRQNSEESNQENTKEQTETVESEKPVSEIRISGNTGAVLTASGEPVKIEGLRNVGTKDVKVRIEGNDEVSLDDIHFDNRSVEQIYRVASHMDDDAAAAALISNYDGKQSTARYTEEFEKAYNWGTAMVSYDNMRSQNAFIIPEHIVKTAYDLGMNKAWEEYNLASQESNRIASGERTFKKGTGEAFDERTDEYAAGDVYSHIDKGIAKKLGITVRSVDEISPENKEITGVINGYFDASQAEMRFSELAESKLGVRVHETMEFMEKMDPAAYKQAVGAVLSYALNKNSASDIYSDIMSYRETYRDVEGTKTFSEAAEEYINDAISGAFMSEDGARDFVEWLGEENLSLDEKKGILRTILDIINNLIDRIKDTLKMGGLTAAQKKIANTTLKEQETIRAIYKECMDSAIKNYQGSEEGETVGKAASVGHSLKIDTKGFNITCRDVMDEYINRATPGKGLYKIEYTDEKDFKEFEGEIQVAKLYYDTYGGKVIVRKKLDIENEYDPDYIINDELWDEKHPNEIARIDERIRHGLKQIASNPGGIIVRLKSNWDIEEATHLALKRYHNSGTFPIDLLFVQNGKFTRALHLEHKERETVVPVDGNLSTVSIAQSQENARGKSQKNKSGEKTSSQNQKAYSVQVKAVKDMSDQELDDAYEAAAKDNSPAQMIYVREAARRNGYDSPALYHGTHYFGFTEFDLSKADDGQSIFVTPDPAISLSYAEYIERKTKSEADAQDVYDAFMGISKNMNDVPTARFKMISEAIKGAERADISNMSNKEAVDYIRKNINKNAKQATDRIVANWTKRVIDRIGELPKEISEEYYGENNNYQDEVKWYNEAVKKNDYINTVNWGQSILYTLIEKNPEKYGEYRKDNRTLSEYVNEGPGSLLTVDGETPIIINDYVEDINNGVYTLYGKTDNMYIVDAQEENWNRIPTPREMFEEQRSVSVSTNSIARFAKEHGYNGVQIKNVVDSASSRAVTKTPGDVWIYFNESDLKSADNVTYDENGDVIPLSERFNDEKRDIRYSVQVDTEGRKLTEEQQEFFKDSKVVDENGALKVVYHGSENDFTVFDMDMARGTEDIEAFFFSGDREEAEGYGNSREFYLNITNPADYDTAYDIFFKHKGETGAGTITREELEKLGYDGVIAVDEDAPEYTEYMVFHPEQIKLISNLNPTEDVDIRYSLTDTKETADLVKENKHLKALVKNLEKEFELTGGELPNETKIKTAARNILKATNSKFDLDTLVENITNVYKYLRQEGADFEEATRVMSEIARGVLEKAEIVDDKHSEAYKDLREQIRKNGIILSEGQRAEVAGAVGLGDYRKRNFGRMKIKKEGATTLDQQWQEWSSQYPELFPVDTPELDMPFVLEGVLDAIQPEVITYDGETVDQMSYDVAMQIYAELAKVPAKETFADTKEREKHEALVKLAESYEDLVEAYRRDNAATNEAELAETLEQVKKEKAQRIARLTDEIETYTELKKSARDPKTLQEYKNVIEKKGQEIARLKQSNEKKIAELRQKYQSQRMKQTEQRRQTETKDKIRRLHEKFRRMITKPTETMHVPAGLMKSAIEVCETVNLGAKEGTKLFQALFETERAFEAIKADTENYGIEDFDPRIAGDIKRLTDLFNTKDGDWTIYDMTADELNQVYECMSEIYESIRLSTKLIRAEGEKDVRRAGKRVIKELEQTKGVGKNLFARTADKLTSSFLNSYREFRRLSGYNDNAELMEMWHELDEGQRRQYQIQMEGEKLLENTTSKYEKLLSEFDSKKGLVKVPLQYKSGNAPVYVTKGMRLALILHGRSTANRLHMGRSGVMIPSEIEKYSKDKKKAYEHVRETKPVTTAALMEMERDLSAEEKDLLRAFEDFFHNWTGRYVNETSMELYGFKKARVENYYPISVYKDYIATDPSALKFDKTIEGAGFLKERVTSTKPLVLESVIDTADRSLNAVSLFAGLAIPIRNFNKIMNVTTYVPADGDAETVVSLPVAEEQKVSWVPENSVKRQMSETWGERARKYIDDMIADLQQARKREATWYDKLRGNYAGAVLTANASVIIKQTSAYPTCAAITGWSPTIKAMFRGGKNNWMLSKADQELIAKWTPLYWVRNKGNSTRELAEIREMNVGVNKLPPVRFVKDAIQKVDMAMVGRFWYAAQYYIDSTRKDLKKGTDEYYSEVAKVFDRCVGETQSTNMTLQNADIMRDPNAGMKLITMFMGQGLQNFGIVYDNLNNMRAKRKMYNDGKVTKEEFTQAKKDFANALSSQLVSAAVFAGLAIVARGLLHRMNPYRDDKEEITAESILSKWFDDFMDNIIGSVPLGSFAYEWTMAAVDAANGKGWSRVYGQDDIVLGALTDFESSTVNLFKAIAKGDDVLDALNDVAKDGSKLMGIPYENVFNLVNGTVKHVEDVASGNFLSYNSDKKAPAAGVITDYLMDSIEKDDKESVEAYTETLYDLGKNAKQINSLISGKLKENEDIIKAAKQKNSGNLDEYTKTVDTYSDKGYPRDAVIKAIDALVKKMNEKPKETPDPEQTKERARQDGTLTDSLNTDEETLYKSSDLTAAVNSGNKKTINTVISEIISDKTEGAADPEEAKKKAKTSIKTALTRVFKAEYMSAETAHDRQSVIQKLQQVKIDGEMLYNQKDFERWAKEYEKLP